MICAPDVSLLKAVIARPTWARYHIDDKIREYVITVELPGVERNEIEAYVSPTALYVKAKPKERLPWAPEVYEVDVNFSEEVDPDDVRAKYENGLLKVIAPKKKAPTKIEVT